MLRQTHRIASLAACAALVTGTALAQADDAAIDGTAVESHLDFDLDFGAASSRTAARRSLDGLDLTIEFTPDYSLAMLQDAPAEGGAPGGGNKEGLAEAATNPIASLIQLQFQNNYVGESKAGDGSSNTFVVQPVIPWKLGELTMLTRITLPLLVATPDLGDPVDREYGLGDLVALNAMVFNIDDGPWKGMYGPVGTVTIPTASSDFTGQGKFQAGPGFVYINLATPGLQWGIFGYQQWSFASAGGDSDRAEVSTLFFQPVLTKHFEGGWYLALQDILWSIDWNDNARWSLPTGARFGRVTKFGNQPVNMFVMPFYDLSGNNKGNEWGIKLNLTMLFPTG